jgi:hypothetical protein
MRFEAPNYTFKLINELIGCIGLFIILMTIVILTYNYNMTKIQLKANCIPSEVNKEEITK